MVKLGRGRAEKTPYAKNNYRTAKQGHIARARNIALFVRRPGRRMRSIEGENEGQGEEGGTRRRRIRDMEKEKEGQ